MRYFVTLETQTTMFVFSYEHNRKGLDFAFRKLQNHRQEIIRGEIESERDGVIFKYQKS